MSVILYHNMVAPYRHDLFAALGQSVELRVWYSTLITRDRHWSTAIPDSYAHRVLPSHVWYGFGRPLVLCPRLVSELERVRPAAIIAVLTRSNALDVLRICRFGRRAGIPVVLWVGAIENDIPTSGVPRVVDAVFERYHRYALARAAGFIYYSGSSRSWAERRGAFGPCATGTQVLAENPRPPRLEPAEASSPVTALFVGKLEERKGIDLLVTAVGALPPALRSRLRLRVAGTGPWAERLTALAPHVEQLGDLPRDELWAEYLGADFLVLPSRHDPWANVINESMSMGTPVLASTQCGGSELVRLAGWTFDARRPDDFAGALATAIHECRSPGRRAAAVAAERPYRPAAAALRITQLLQELGVSVSAGAAAA